MQVAPFFRAYNIMVGAGEGRNENAAQEALEEAIRRGSLSVDDLVGSEMEPIPHLQINLPRVGVMFGRSSRSRNAVARMLAFPMPKRLSPPLSASRGSNEH